VGKQIIKEILILGLYLINAMYAFHFWGIGWGLLNLTLPIAMITDLFKLILFQH